MKMYDLKVGIVGLGEQTTDNLLPSLILNHYASVSAICDIDERKLNSIGEKTGIKNRYTCYKQMIQEAKPDVVVVSSFPEVHFEVAKYCILHGIHIFVEKPPVSNTEQLNELIGLSQFTSIKTGVGMNFSYTDSHKTLKEIISDIEFGKISFISVEHVSSKPVTPLWHLDTTIDSFLLAQLIHPLDYILSVGGSYHSINVHCSRLHSPFFIQIMIEFDNGIIGCLKSGSFYPRFKHEVEIISTTGNTVKANDLASIEITKIDIPTPFNVRSKNCTTLYTQSPLKSGYSKAGYIIEFNSYFEHILFNTDYKHSFSKMHHVYVALDQIRYAIHNKNKDRHLRHDVSISKAM
ncbi:Gfo/Idh/MocA family protein [Terrimonas pollutisoli]|uniref:Gfo/Idh/MocA family protein n=1 Tax=Terrimonas pollutisoli TaxID=3034147 RepID=UPI0023EC078D|nr:Gfo/Idh/MocA family oxidoreductase [Terrimonas sp. H1YJ31]